MDRGLFLCGPLASPGVQSSGPLAAVCLSAPFLLEVECQSLVPRWQDVLVYRPRLRASAAFSGCCELRRAGLSERLLSVFPRLYPAAELVDRAVVPAFVF